MMLPITRARPDRTFLIAFAIISALAIATFAAITMNCHDEDWLKTPLSERETRDADIRACNGRADCVRFQRVLKCKGNFYGDTSASSWTITWHPELALPR